MDPQLKTADDRYARLSSWSDVGTVYMTLANPHATADRDDEGTAIARVADRTTVASYVRSAPDRRLYRVFFWRQTAIVQEIASIDNSTDGGRIHLSLYNLATGARTELRPADGRALGYLGAAALAGDQFAVAIEKDGQKDRCLHIFDLASGTESDAGCLPSGEGGIFSVRGSDYGFTYLATSGVTVSSCRSAFWIAVPVATGGAAPTRIGSDNCLPFDHARHGDWNIWSEVPAKYNAQNNHTASVLFAGNGARKESFGLIDTGSVTSCGSHIYWRRHDPNDLSFSEIVRWKPGASNAEIIYRSNTDPGGEHWNLTFPGCSQNVVTINRYRPGPKPPAARQVLYLPGA